MKCFACDMQIRDEARFCPYCGQDQSARPQEKLCSHCGQVVLPDAKFCGYCGADQTKLPEPVAEEPVAVEEVETQAEACPCCEPEEVAAEVETLPEPEEETTAEATPLQEEPPEEPIEEPIEEPAEEPQPAAEEAVPVAAVEEPVVAAPVVTQPPVAAPVAPVVQAPVYHQPVAPIYQQPVVQPVYQMPVARPAFQLPTGRALWKMFLLSIVTLGIYPMVIWSKMSMEINVVASRHDGKWTMHFLWMAFLAPLTLFIYPLVWIHGLCERIGEELQRRKIAYKFSAATFWLWNLLYPVLGAVVTALLAFLLPKAGLGQEIAYIAAAATSLISFVGPFVYLHKNMKAMNLMNADYNEKG